MTLREVPGLNRKSERIIKMTAFLMVEDSLQLAAGIFNQPAAEKAVCIHRPTHATTQFEAA